MPRQINYTRPPLYEYQKAILNSPARYTITEAATKVGKTASHIVWLFEQALSLSNTPGGAANKSVWWVAPTFGQARIAYYRMKTQITNPALFTCHETNLTITLITGAIIAFKSAEKPDNLYGDDVYAAVFDEFTRAREQAWHALRSTITSTGGKVKFIGNVKGNKNWGHKLAMRAKTGEDPNWQYFKLTAYDAAAAGMKTKDGRPFIDEIEEAKRDLPEAVFRELYLAEAAEEGSNPFGFVFIKQCTYDLSAGPAICFGTDLAKSFDFFANIGLDKNARTCQFDRFQKDWKQTTEFILNLPRVPMAIDSTGVGDPIGEDICRHRDNVELFVFTGRTRQQLLEGLALGIQKRELTFPEGRITYELEQFEFVYTRTGVKYAAPDGEHDDCVMALALAWHKYQEARYQTGPSIS